MTENEATREMTFEEEYEILQKEKEELFAMEICDSEPPFANCVVRRASRCIRKLLEEIQQYRAIGAVKEIRIREAQFKRLSEGYLNDLTLLREYQSIGTVEDIQLIFSLCKDLERIVKKYEAIGTIDEFKALKEKNEPRKIKGKRFVEAICPWCESELIETYWAFGGIHYCSNCGQKLDWSE